MAYDKSYQAKVWPVIISIMETYVAPVFSGRLSADVPASLTTFPMGVYQSQDGGGKNDDTINMNGWTGLVTVRSIDSTQSGAWDKALSVINALQSVTHVNYDISINLDRPLKFPVEKLTQGNIYTAGLVISFGIYPK